MAEVLLVGWKAFQVPFALSGVRSVCHLSNPPNKGYLPRSAAGFTNVKFTEYDQIPESLLELPASALHQQLDGPSLIHVEGRRKRPLVVSVLQHGNETTGWEALRRLLKSHYQFDELPRSLLVFVGNVQAARHRLRRLDDQPDFNRCWPGGSGMDPAAARMFRDLMDRILEFRPWACIDIHNNTGLNPHYAAINRVTRDILRLAACFSPKVVYFTRPPGTMSHAFSAHCPALTLECGQVGDVHGVDHSLAFLETVLHLEDLASIPLDLEVVHLFHMVATVTIPDEVLFDFVKDGVEVNEPETVDGSAICVTPTPFFHLALRDDLDSLNFREIPRRTSFGRVLNGTRRPLYAVDTRGRDVTAHYFCVDEGEVRTARPIMPSMLTLDRRVIQQDCLCYLMERLSLEEAAALTDIDPLPDAIPRASHPGGPGSG